MYHLELRDFILSHENWEELLTTDPYNLKISRDGDYIMFKYNQISSDFTIPLVREARGIIFRESDWGCVCEKFTKFGNYGESYCPDIDWATASVQEKVDGSLIGMFYDNGWHICTNGTIDAFKAELNDVKYPTFGALVEDAMPISWGEWEETADPKCTYMFELVSPYNRVVIPYEETKLYFLGMRDMEDGKEWNPEDSDMSYFFEMPKRYPLHSLEDVQKAANALPWDQEGYVVCDRNFNRVKIKSSAYILAHYARNNGNISKKNLIEIILSSEIEEFLIYANEYKEELEKILYYMNCVKDNSLNALKHIKSLKLTNKKEYAKVVLAYQKYIQSYLFENFDKYVSWEEHVKKLDSNKWLKILEQNFL
mgnify:CR=1 FL=1